jgi:predicted nucleic acid-binding protein
MDEEAGREVAESRGMKPKGTRGIPDAAGAKGLVYVPEAVGKLRETNFHASPTLYERLLDRHR